MFFSPSIYAEYLMIFIILDYFMPNLFFPLQYMPNASSHTSMYPNGVQIHKTFKFWIRDFAKSIHDSSIYTRNHEVVLRKYSIKSCLFSF